MSFFLLVDVEPKRRRGPTRMLDIWDMEDKEVINVKLDNYGRPIGEEATALNRFLGSIVRRSQYAPINYKSWKLMPLKYKEEMLKEIEVLCLQVFKLFLYQKSCYITYVFI